ncbi:MAG: radical SAM protein [Akkermansiaceae bacterium]|nr:radical SAM protein [Akkermansiaceae bacterium]
MNPPVKTTRSRCPICLAPAPARVWKEAVASETDANGGGPIEQVMLTRDCPEHGEITTRIASDARFYWLSHGRPENRCAPGADGCCGNGTEKPAARRASDGAPAGTLGANAFAPEGSVCETLSTCLALIEIVDSCNLSCPSCYADSQPGTGARLDYVPLEELQRRIQSAIDRKGGIEILQFSGGEPTLHPEFFELLGWAQRHPDIDYVLINTNGVRIAADAAFAEGLREAYQYGKVQLYLQFDGPQEAGQIALRGVDLRRTRGKTLRVTGEMGLPVTLAMTVQHDNLPHLWEAVAFGLRFDHVRGISFQPLFRSGRNPASLDGEPLNAADIVTGLISQSDGKLGPGDFTPLPCGDPNCAIIGYLLKTGDGIRSVGDFIDFGAVQGFLRDKVRYRLADLTRCGCENEPLGELLHAFELDERHTFRLFIKPFMDAHSWDDDRIDRCCTHVIRPDGRLDSFCRYYAQFPDAAPPPGAPTSAATTCRAC